MSWFVFWIPFDIIREIRKKLRQHFRILSNHFPMWTRVCPRLGSKVELSSLEVKVRVSYSLPCRPNYYSDYGSVLKVLIHILACCRCSSSIASPIVVYREIGEQKSDLQTEVASSWVTRHIPHYTAAEEGGRWSGENKTAEGELRWVYVELKMDKFGDNCYQAYVK